MSERITVRCPKCKAQLKLKNRKAVGKKVPCPKCSRPFVVTPLDDFDDAETESTSSDQDSGSDLSPTSRRGASESGNSKKSLVVFSLVMGGVLLLGLASMALQSGIDSAAPPGGAYAGNGSVPPNYQPPQAENVPSTPPAADSPPTEDTPAGESSAGDGAGNGPAEPTPPPIAVVSVEESPQPITPVDEPAETAAPVESESTTAEPVEVAQSHTPAAPVEHIGRQIPPFSGVAVDNTTYTWDENSEQIRVVAFMGVECPLANLYFPRMAELHGQFIADESVEFLAINSNAQDVLQDVQRQAQEFRLPFPVLKDASGEIAALFGATRTPEVFVVDAAGAVQYHGMFDDQYGYLHRRAEPSQPLVSQAVTSLLAGRAPDIQEYPIQGCHIGRSRQPNDGATTSFYRDVLPILQQNCQRCHREGNIGPFVLSEYEDVANWAETIREAVVEHRMPPWKADPAHGEFANDMSLSEAQYQTLVTWVDEGSPEGNPAEAPAPVEWDESWSIGEPDEVFNMPKAEKIPASGVVPYKYVFISPPFKRDRWVSAMECRMGNPSVVHHILALLKFPKDGSRDQDGLTKGFFAGAVPGNAHTVLRPGFAKLIPKGARIVFQMHYTPNGTPTSDKSSLGLIYTEEPEFVVDTYALGDHKIRLKAGDANYKLNSTLTMQGDVAISSLMPHLHVRGTSFKYRARFPGDKQDTTLLSIPKWDFNWQHEYKLTEPVMLKKGTKLTVEATWDNSENNPNNFLPLVDVTFGEQTFDEMFIGYVNYIVPIRQFREMNPGTKRKKSRY